jgi:hypothetical protein
MVTADDIRAALSEVEAACGAETANLLRAVVLLHAYGARVYLVEVDGVQFIAWEYPPALDDDDGEVVNGDEKEHVSLRAR